MTMNDNKKPSILIVDDDRLNITALNHILKPTYSTLIATNGKTGIEMARKNIPDLILLDVIMPDRSGFDVLSELKSADLTRGIPVIFITSQNSAEDEAHGFMLGAVDYITKPFHDVVVLARVNTHLQIIRQLRTIERLSMLDALTDIPNRRGFDKQLLLEWERSIREKTPISILMIDVDKFKVYNDTYGHPQGDVLLHSVAGILRRMLRRPTDYAARWGGEEFAVLLPNTELAAALKVAERIRVGVESLVIPFTNGKNTSTTVSIGVNTETPTAHSSVADFISGADRALYTAKNSGRNIVRPYSALI